MGLYPNRRDPFNVDTGWWDLYTTNGSTVLSGGKRSFDKTGSPAWNETGMVQNWSQSGGSAPLWKNGDEVIITFQFDNAPFDDGNGIRICWRVTSALLTSGNVGILFHTTSGVDNTAAQTGGICTGNPNLTDNFVTGVDYKIRWTINQDGKLTVDIIGGPWSTWQTMMTPLLAIADNPSYPVWFQAQLSNGSADFSILDWQWSNPSIQFGSTGSKFIKQGLF